MANIRDSFRFDISVRFVVFPLSTDQSFLLFLNELGGDFCFAGQREKTSLPDCFREGNINIPIDH